MNGSETTWSRRRPAGRLCGSGEAGPAGRHRYPLERLLGRARDHGERLTDLELRCGNVLFHNDGRHLTAQDVSDILVRGGQDVPFRLVARSLAELARRGIVQAIAAGDGLTFYDVDLRPHLHVYDPERRTLEDADASLVVSAEWMRAAASCHAPPERRSSGARW